MNTDFSASLCLSYDSLKQLPPVVNLGHEWYTSDNTNLLTANYEPISVNSSPAAIYAKRYDNLQKIKDAFDDKDFIIARDAMNPFETIGRSIFINRAAIKLANIDSVLNVTPNIFTFDQKQSSSPFTFCDVAAGPGGFTQYMQYRYPNSKGYGMTLRSDKLDWNKEILDMSRFTPFYGPDKTGNLYSNWNWFIEYVLHNEPNGVDLVTADGGFDLEEGDDKTLLRRQEFLSSRLLLTQALVSVACCKLGGNAVIKVFDTVTKFSAHVLYILSRCFEQIMIFKPVTSRPANAERYVVCMNRKANIKDDIEILSNATERYTDTLYLSSLFQEPLPPAFEKWLMTNNNISIDSQLRAAQNILLYLNGQNPVLAEYNIFKFLIIWNLPDTPIHSKTSNIKIK